MAAEITRVTEAPNELTADLDVAVALQFVRLLRQSDAQLFSGWGGLPGMDDPETMRTVAQCVNMVQHVLRSPQPRCIVLCGAGTSGRLAWYVARAFNLALEQARQRPCLRFLMAGGDAALVKPREGAEDSCDMAERDFVSLAQREAGADTYAGADAVKDHVGLVIGITCGLSATYVGAVLHYAMQRDVPSVLLGFNPAAAVTPVPVDGWTMTFRDVLTEMLARCSDTFSPAPLCAVLNPVVGPEPVTGSTRMKGGTATKLLLEIVLTLAIQAVEGAGVSDPVALERQARCMLEEYSAATVRVYRSATDIAAAVDLAGAALRRGGRIVYLASEALGRLAVIDASECPPTYGADFSDVRAFVRGGWPSLLRVASAAGEEGSERAGGSGAGQELPGVSWREFEEHWLPTLKEGDLVVGLTMCSTREEPELERLLTACADNSLAVVRVRIVADGAEREGGTPSPADATLVVRLPRLGWWGEGQEVQHFGELAGKLVLNAISTGAHVQRGTVYQNRMINLMVTNAKLFRRAIGLVTALAGCGEDQARHCLLRSIYKTDAPSPAVLAATVSAHVSAAGKQRKLLPLALLLATGVETVREAEALIEQEPVLRRLILARRKA